MSGPAPARRRVVVRRDGDRAGRGRARGSTPTSSRARSRSTPRPAGSCPRWRRGPTCAGSCRSSTRRWPTPGRRSTDLDAVAVTSGPGLAGSLLVGINFAKTLAWAHGKPLVGGQPPRGARVRGLAARSRRGRSRTRRRSRWSRWSCRAGTRSSSRCATTSRTGSWARPSTTPRARRSTRSGRLLGLGYPGGPAISDGRRPGRPRTTAMFPRAWMGDSYDFSFSGLKTAAQRIIGEARADAGMPAGERERAAAGRAARGARLGLPGRRGRRAGDEDAAGRRRDRGPGDRARRRRGGERRAAGADRGRGRGARDRGSSSRGPACAPTTAR